MSVVALIVGSLSKQSLNRHIAEQNFKMCAGKCSNRRD